MIESYAALAGTIVDAPARLGDVRLVAVDGGAGGGKSTFAARLEKALRDIGADTCLLHTDDLLEGWTDLGTYWPRLRGWVLDPLAEGRPGRYRRYDWLAGRFGDDWHEVPVPRVLVIEGVASARAEIRPDLTLSVFVDAPVDLRLARGIARDGEELRPQWDRWLRDERAHFAADRTREAADVVVDGDPSIRHDRETRFVRII